MSLRADRGTIVLLALAFLALPYLVDVAFFADSTPTHFSQENLVNEDIQVSEDDISFAADKYDNAAVEHTLPKGRHFSKRNSFQAGAVIPSQYHLSGASLIPRSPPPFP